MPVTGSMGMGTGKARSFTDWSRLLLPVVGFLWRTLCSDCRLRNESRNAEKRGRLYVSLLIIGLVCSALRWVGFFLGGEEDRVQRADRTAKRKVERTQLFLKQSCEQKNDSLPSFRQVGHWSVPEGLMHDTPIHIRLAADILCLLVGAGGYIAVSGVESSEWERERDGENWRRLNQASWR